MRYHGLVSGSGSVMSMTVAMVTVGDGSAASTIETIGAVGITIMTVALVLRYLRFCNWSRHIFKIMVCRKLVLVTVVRE